MPLTPTGKAADWRAEAEEHDRLCREAERLGIPTSLDDPGSPKTVSGLREAVAASRCKADDEQRPEGFRREFPAAEEVE